MAKYIAETWREWLMLVIVVLVASFIGGYVGASVPTHWFKTGICGE